MPRQNWKLLKRKRELKQLELFRECFAETAKYEINPIENDPPDGFFQTENKKISIELTQIFWDCDKDGINKKEQESLSDSIMDLAESKYAKLNLPPVQINVSFTDKYGLIKYDDNTELNPSDKENLSDYIVQKVIEYLPASNRTFLYAPEYDAKWDRILHPKIQSICISRFPALTENCWSADGGGVIPTITFKKVYETIEKKGRDLLRYKYLYDLSWLVIVEDWSGISNYFDFTFIEEVLAVKFKTNFDKVFILRSKRREVIELNISQ